MASHRRLSRVAHLAALTVLICTSRAHAHAEGFSGLRVYVGAEDVRAVVSLHTRDLSGWFPPAKYPDYVAQVSRALTGAPQELLELSFDGQPLAATNATASTPETGLIEIELHFSTPPPESRAMQVWSKHLNRLPRDHQQLLFVQGPRGETLAEETLSVEQDVASIDLPPTAAVSSPSSAPAATRSVPPPGRRATESSPRRISFFRLGLEHIATGYDHLLFLAALLLVCRSFREAAGVITFFTVAHSITLSLAALDVVRLSGQIVEPAIAASIVYVGIENLFGSHRFLWRAAITFAFGLIHGLGFASALREVGLGSDSIGLARPLLMFTLGLEAGQLCIAAVLLRILLTLKKRRWLDPRWIAAASASVALIGLYWLVTRVIQS